MTHDELLAKIVNYPDSILFAQYYRALRAIAELHKPSGGWFCDACANPNDEVIYPCPTIQAIEKELL